MLPPPLLILYMFFRFMTIRKISQIFALFFRWNCVSWRITYQIGQIY